MKNKATEFFLNKYISDKDLACMQMDLILSFDSLKRSNFQSVAMVFVLKHADVADLHSADKIEAISL